MKLSARNVAFLLCALCGGRVLRGEGEYEGRDYACCQEYWHCA